MTSRTRPLRDETPKRLYCWGRSLDGIRLFVTLRQDDAAVLREGGRSFPPEGRRHSDRGARRARRPRACRGERSPARTARRASSLRRSSRARAAHWFRAAAPDESAEWFPWLPTGRLPHVPPRPP